MLEWTQIYIPDLNQNAIQNLVRKSSESHLGIYVVHCLWAVIYLVRSIMANNAFICCCCCCTMCSVCWLFCCCCCNTTFRSWLCCSWKCFFAFAETSIFFFQTPFDHYSASTPPVLARSYCQLFVTDKKLHCCHCNFLLRGGLLLLSIWLPFLIVAQFFTLLLTWYLQLLLYHSLFFGSSPDQFLVALPLHFLPGQLFALTGFLTLSVHQVQYQLRFFSSKFQTNGLSTLRDRYNYSML